MLKDTPLQVRLSDEGRILFQPDASNPLPGAPVAVLKKGEKILEPAIDLIEANVPSPEQAHALLAEWLKGHIRKVLEPLVALEQAEGLPAPAQGICTRLYETLGIVPRDQLEGLIRGLDNDMRQQLRSRQVRLGPVLVFLPALNKPAAVRMRGLLWALWHGQALPPPLPHNGAVSVRVDPAGVDGDFYRAIGYPVYGTRAIRIDMLDRVINAVYDGAKDGKFQAKHEMAEWLGCGIEELYGVLTAMGHKEISRPVPVQKTEEKVEEITPEEKAPEEKAEVPAEIAKVPHVRPELATFALKRGKAFEKAQPRPAKREDKNDSPRREKKENRRPRGDKKDHGKERVRVIHAAAKTRPEDSPFAILEQLRVKKDAS